MNLERFIVLAVKVREMKHLLFALAERSRSRQRNRSRPVGQRAVSDTILAGLALSCCAPGESRFRADRGRRRAVAGEECR